MHAPQRSLRRLATALAAALMVSVLARAEDPPATPPAGEKPPAPRSGSVTILHTNDWHGYALAETPRYRRGKKRSPKGGIPAMAAAFAKLRADLGADRVLALDAGDLLSGHPAATIAEDGVMGGAFVKAWNEIGFDAWVIGNHDFDAGRANAEALVKLARPLCLVANLYRTDDGKPVLKSEPFRVYDRGGLKIGVIGLTAPDLARLTSAETMSGMKAFGLVDAVRPYAEKLATECDLVLALTHAGVEADRELARAVPELDVIVGGHSHTRLETPLVEGDCLIVQAGAHGREYGRLDLTVEARKVVKHRGQLVPVIAEGVTPTAAMAGPMGRIEARLAELEAEVLGETTQALTRGNYYRETLIGSFIADALRHAAKAEVAFMNSGGVRADFNKGPVTRGELLRVIPNDNALATFEVTGAELESILLHNAKAVVTEDHGVLQVGGVRYRWRREGEGKGATAKILRAEVAGKPIDPEKTYTCVSSDFIVNEQAQKYFGLVPKSKKALATSVREAICAALKEGPIELPDRGRMWEERERDDSARRTPGGARKGGEKEKRGGDEKEKGEGEDEGEREEGEPDGKKGEGGGEGETEKVPAPAGAPGSGSAPGTAPPAEDGGKP